MNSNCLFCKIGAGEIPSVKILETDSVLAFLDIAPVAKGHTLVISKRDHSEQLVDAPDDVVAELVDAARRIIRAMKAAGYEGVNLLQNNGAAAGQAVPHLHFHLIPRHPEKSLAWKSGAGAYASDAERDAIAAAIRAHL